MRRLSFSIPCLALVCAVVGCSPREEPRREVIVFTALDRIYAEPILRRFEARTSIAVRPVYDAEAAKTTGLVNRLIARRDDPECDVLWNNEPVQTMALARMGLLAPYASPAALRIDPMFRDPGHRWTGFAARMRVVIYRRDRFAHRPPPVGLGDFLDPAHRGRAAIASPFYGTTFTHVSVLLRRWGAPRLERWLEGLKGNAIVIAPGNGPVRDLVAAGECDFGLTDTDDAHSAILDGKPVGVALPDGEALLIPNTVSLVSGAPHADAGRALIDFLLSREVEAMLAASRSAQIPLGVDLRDTPTPWDDLLEGATRIAIEPESDGDERVRLIALLRRMEMDR